MIMISITNYDNDINYHLMYMDDIKLFAKKWKSIKDSNTNNKNLQS